MKKVYVFQSLLSVAVMLAMTAAVAQHVPVVDPAAECPALCSAPGSDPVACMMLPTPPDAGSECMTTPGAPCLAIWPNGPFTGMPTWPLNVYGEIVDPDGTFGNGDEYFDLQSIAENDPLVVTLPAAGSYDFCAWMDQLVCSLAPFASMLAEIEQFSYLIQCTNMDINGEIDDCKEIPVSGNGIPDRYEFAVLAAVLNDPAHPQNAAAVAAMQTNLDYLADVIIVATSAVDVGGVPLDARGLSYFNAPWLIPSLGGVLAAAAAMDDPQTNAALDELLGLLADLGLEPPVGGIGAVCDGVAATGQSGDISGNGFTNREIYEWFIQVNPAMTPTEYATLALDPATVVPAKVTVSGGGSASVGENVVLTANVANPASGYSAASFVWYEWAVVGQDADLCDIWDWVVISGETGSALTLTNAQIEDSGRYAVEVSMDDGSKAVTGTILASTTLVVSDTSGVPVGGALGLTLLAGACALAGAFGIRRRK
jgi:hypothetical protein